MPHSVQISHRAAIAFDEVGCVASSRGYNPATTFLPAGVAAMRSVLRFSPLALVLAAITSTASADDAPKPVRIATGVSGHIHPAACVTKAGTVLVIFSQSNHKDLRLSRSTDGGKTWTEPAAFAHTAK